MSPFHLSSVPTCCLSCPKLSSFILVCCYCAFGLSCEPCSSAVTSLFLCHLFDPSLSGLSGITSLQVSSEGIEYNLKLYKKQEVCLVCLCPAFGFVTCTFPRLCNSVLKDCVELLTDTVAGRFCPCPQYLCQEKEHGLPRVPV